MSELRDQIFNNKSLSQQPAKFCGVDVIVVGLSAAKFKDYFGKAIKNMSATGSTDIDFMSVYDRVGEMLVDCIRDPIDVDKHIFERNDAQPIMEKPQMEVTRIFGIIMDLSGENKVTLGEAIKNS